jgi:hypothetical protein
VSEGALEKNREENGVSKGVKNFSPMIEERRVSCKRTRILKFSLEGGIFRLFDCV